jgi:hypothetical protein
VTVRGWFDHLVGACIGWLGTFQDGQADRERGAFARLGRDRDVAPYHLKRTA